MKPTTEVVKQYFDRPTYLQNGRIAIGIRAMIVKELLGDVSSARIIDFGCGDGSLSIPLLTSHNSLTLVDLSPRMLELAASRVPEDYKPHVTIINGPLGDFQPTAPVDAVICVGVLAHVPSVEEAIAKIAQCLKPGGQAVLELTPNPHPLGGVFYPYYAIRRAFSGNPLGYKENKVTIARLIETCARHGLEYLRKRRHSLPLPTMRFWSEKLLSEYALLTLRHPLLSRLGTEHILLFRKKGGSSSGNGAEKPAG